MTPQPHNTLLYHITHVDNLPNIIKSGGLWCDKKRVGKGFDSTNIAHADIKERRLKIPVPLYSGTTLANYVPFYFCNRAPMLYSIHTGYVKGYSDGQDSVIYLVTTIARVLESESRWCFTDGHAVMTFSEFYNQIADLSKIDWLVIDNWSWRTHWKIMTVNAENRRSFGGGFCSWDLFDKIGVISNGIKKRVENILQTQSYQPDVSIEPSWYY